MSVELSLFGPEEPADARPKLPCFNCGLECRTVLVIQAAIRREIPCCFNVARGCDAAATAEGKR